MTFVAIFVKKLEATPRVRILRPNQEIMITTQFIVAMIEYLVKYSDMESSASRF